MVAYHCCVPMCVNDSRKNEEVPFHSFPSEQKRRSEWIVKIRRDPGDYFVIKPHTKVCSALFKISDFKKTLTGRNVLLTSAVPSVFAWTTETAARPSPSKRRRRLEADQGTDHDSLSGVAVVNTPPPLSDHDYSHPIQEQPGDIRFEVEAAKEELDRIKAELRKAELRKAESVSRFGLARFMYNDSMIRFYTGFPSWRLLERFISLVKPTADKMKTWAQIQRARGKPDSSRVVDSDVNSRFYPKDQACSIEDQLFLFLCKIKLGLFEQDLAERFQISIATVSRTVLTWTNFLYFLLGCLPIWPSREQVDKTVPMSFQDVFPNVRVIIDCTEMKVQTPSSLTLHSEFYSNYKSATTLKGLIGITPAGAVSFVSALYTGSISDKEITRRSGLIELLQPNDGVMADKGFTILDLLTPKKCTLNIPPFLAEKPQFSKEDVKKTQEIAKQRIHVERAIRRVKEFHIFD